MIFSLANTLSRFLLEVISLSSYGKNINHSACPLWVISCRGEH
jgi:hypothetical protein